MAASWSRSPADLTEYKVAVRSVTPERELPSDQDLGWQLFGPTLCKASVGRCSTRGPLGIVGVPCPDGSHGGGNSGPIRRLWIIALDRDDLVENGLIVRKPRCDEGFDLFVHASIIAAHTIMRNALQRRAISSCNAARPARAARQPSPSLISGLTEDSPYKAFPASPI